MTDTLQSGAESAPTIDTLEFRVLLTDVCAAYNSGLSVSKRERAFIAYIDAELARRAAAPHAATDESLSEHNARFAIDAAIQFGRENRNQPPSTDHWLYEYWNIGRQLAALGATGWDNITPMPAVGSALVASKDEQQHGHVAPPTRGTDSQQDADARDAARYQWLCANNFDRQGLMQIHTWVHTWEPHSQTGEPTEWKARVRGGALDRAIDEAILATQPTGNAEQGEQS